MKHAWLAAIPFALATACATSPSPAGKTASPADKAVAAGDAKSATAAPGPAEAPERDPIVGEWEGVGRFKGLNISMKADRTGTMGTAEEPVLWTRNAEGGYRFYQNGEPPENGMKGVLETNGRLGLDMNGRPGALVYLERAGAAKEAVPAPDPKQLIGEWFYAYTKNETMPLAFQYKTIAFLDDGRTIWKTPLLDEPLEGKVKAKGSKLTFKAAKAAGPNATAEYGYRFEDGGKTLVLVFAAGETIKAELVFKPASEMIENPIPGKWVTQPEELGPGSTLELEILPTGRRTTHLTLSGGKGPPPNDQGVYTFWNSPLGPTATHVSFAPEMGMFMCDLALCERVGDTLIMTPILVDNGGALKQFPEGKATYTLKK